MKTKIGNIILVRMRVIDPNGDEGMVLCVADSFEGDLNIEPEAIFPVCHIDIVEDVRGIHKPCLLEQYEQE